MTSNANPSDDQACAKRDASDLLNDYQTLSREYDKILKISQQILVELIKDEKDETRLSELLDQKLEIGRNIKLLSQKISDENLKFLPSTEFSLNEAKREFEKIRSKVDELWNLEKRIKKLTENC